MKSKDENVPNPEEAPQATELAAPVSPPKGQNSAAPVPAAKTGGPEPMVFKDVSQLPAEVKDFIDQLLTEGATFEDVVESVAEQGQARISLQAVANYFRNNLELQKRRVRWTVERAQELKNSMQNPGTAEADLAEAVFLGGFLAVNRKEAQLNLKDAEHARMSRENLQLRNQVLRLKARKLEQDSRFNEVRIRLSLARLQLLLRQINELKQVMHNEGKDNKLGPETLRKIQEIYGLASLPSVPAPR